MICSNCQTENRPGRKFCLRCGSALATLCPNCGASNEPDAGFCGECGTRLGGPVAPGVGRSAGPAAAPVQPIPAPAAERRVVSVLFADLVGFTSIAETLDTEDARELLTRYFAASRDIVQRYGGVIEKFIGDAVMAVWGTPTAHEDDAERAVRAALDLAAMVPGLAAGRAGVPLRLRAAVLTGEAAVSLGADGQGMVAGDLVNTASRLQSAAEPGTVLVGESTMRAASRAITFEPAGGQVLKGKESPVPAWRAVAVVALVGGAGRSDLIEPPFVGRDAEFSALKERLHATARDRRARLVSVTGVAGIGKSRLAWELEKYIDGLVEDVYWHHGRSPAYGDGLSFWALGEMVRRRADILERDDPTTTTAKLEACLAEWVADEDERRWIAPRLRALLGIEEAPPGSREELFAAWRAFFERIADRGSTVLVFEDLQWADAGLVDFIESILEWSRAKPLLIVTLARPELLERRPTWGAGQREFTALHLAPLSEPAMAELVRGMAPGLPPSLVDQIVERSEGIPLYAVELFRMLLDRGQLVAGPDGYRASSESADLHAPETLQALIAARLDALPPAERRLLQDASVLGKTFTVDALAAVTGPEATGQLEPLLRNLVRRELLSVDLDPRSPERGQYGFVGALIREVAYGTLARRDRRERHVAAARFFEALGDDELAGVLASHYTDAYAASTPGPEADAVAAQARISLRGAAERSLALASPAQAAGFLRRALAVTTDPAEVARLYGEIAVAEEKAGNWPRSHEAASESVERYGRLGDAAGFARSASVLGECLLVEGDPDAAIAVLTRALSGLAGVDAEPLEVALRAKLARAEMFRARPTDALPWIDTALEVAARLDLVEAITDLLVTRAWALSGLGRQREAIVLQHGAIAMAREHGLHRVRFRAINNLVSVIGELQPRQSLDLLRDAMAEAERLGDRDWADKLAFGAIVAIWTGDWDYAEVVLQQHWRDDQPILAWVGPAAARVAIDAARGEQESADRLFAEVARRVGGSRSPQDEYGLHVAAIYAAYPTADMPAVLKAARSLVDVARATSFDPNEAALYLAMAAAWVDDLSGIREAIDLLRSVALRSELVLGLQSCAEGALAARDGRPTGEAARLYGIGLEVLRRLGHELWSVIVELDAIGVLDPRDPVAQESLAHARAFVEAHRALALGRLADQRLGRARARPGTSPPATSMAAGTAQAGTAQNVLTTS